MAARKSAPKRAAKKPAAPKRERRLKRNAALRDSADELTPATADDLGDVGDVGDVGDLGTNQPVHLR